MKKVLNILSLLLLMSATFYSCERSEDDIAFDNRVPNDVLTRLKDLGFDITNQAPQRFEEGYLVEGDIYLTNQDLVEMKSGMRIPEVEQYSTNNLVRVVTQRNIAIYIPSGSFNPSYIAALDVAVGRYNAEHLKLTFSRVDASYPRPTIVFRRLSSFDENNGVLGSSGFPTSYGSPYGQIKLSGIMQTVYGLDVNEIATIMAHEIGHCIGFRHTDYYDRSISCGGLHNNEEDGGVGANLIPGTPKEASLGAQSWMLACTDGRNRPFNKDDKKALNYLY